MPRILEWIVDCWVELASSLITNDPIHVTYQTMKYGFASLLIFVVSTIIGGVVAKIQYNDVLANIDYLHGTVRLLLYFKVCM